MARKFTAPGPFEILVAPPPGTTRRKFTQQIVLDDQNQARLALLTDAPSASGGTITIDDANFVLQDVLATAVITLIGVPTAGDTITINGNPLTAVAGARTPGSDDFSVSSGTLAGVVADIVAAINDGANSFSGDVTATDESPSVCLVAVATGTAGNVSLATDNPTDIALSGDSLLGGVSQGKTTIRLGDFTLVVGLQWETTLGDATASATALAAAIDNLPGFSASSVGADVTIVGPAGPGEVLFEADQGGTVTHFTLSPDGGSLAVGGPSVGPPAIS